MTPPPFLGSVAFFSSSGRRCRCLLFFLLGGGFCASPLFWSVLLSPFSSFGWCCLPPPTFGWCCFLPPALSSLLFFGGAAFSLPPCGWCCCPPVLFLGWCCFLLLRLWVVLLSQPSSWWRLLLVSFWVLPSPPPWVVLLSPPHSFGVVLLGLIILWMVLPCSLLLK